MMTFVVVFVLAALVVALNYVGLEISNLIQQFGDDNERPRPLSRWHVLNPAYGAFGLFVIGLLLYHWGRGTSIIGWPRR